MSGAARVTRDFYKQKYSNLLFTCIREGLVTDVNRTVDQIMDDPDYVGQLQTELNKVLCAVCGERRGSPHHWNCGLTEGEWPE
jgi:hypothetical protein